ncbi:hypothetical protein [Pseudoxanthomonas mexicana]
MRIGIKRDLLMVGVLGVVALGVVACRQPNPPAAEAEQAPAPAPVATEAVEPAAPAMEDPFAATASLVPVTSKLDGFAVVKSCNVDSVVDANTDKEASALPQSGQAKFIGWAADSDAGKLPTRVAVLLRGVDKFYVVGGQLSLEREDVASSTGNAALLKSGFALPASLAGVEPGSYTLDVLMDFDGAKASCATAETVQVQ